MVAPAPFATAWLSGIGTRPNNEDRTGFDIVQGIGCWVVADGLGGHLYGEEAAEAAVGGILQAFRERPGCSADDLRRLLDVGQAIVQQQQTLSPDRAEMRTTVVVLLADGQQARWAHAGDSRLYLFRDGQVLTRTRDHSVAQALVNSGELDESSLRNAPERCWLLRDLGGAKPLRASVVEQAWALAEGDVFLLCSDGFWEPLDDALMAEALSAGGDLQASLNGLAGRIEALAVPGQDNYTALAVRVGSLESWQKA